MKYITFLLLLLIAGFSQAQELLSSAGQEIVFNHVNVIPMDQERVLENQAVVVKGGKIVSVSDATKAKLPGMPE
jgi:imidazolonepropionase-like amidohydrolase